MKVLLPKIMFVGMLFASLFILTPRVLAQIVDDYVSVAPPQDWIEIQNIREEDFKNAKGQDVAYILTDEQYRVTKQNAQKYVHYIEMLKTPQGVEDNSTFSLNFDPEYQKVTLHHLYIIRDGQKLDKLTLEDFELYRYETDRYRLMYNGELELSYIIPGVRVGDILDYAYTVSGKNPAFGEHIAGAIIQQYAVPVMKISRRVVAADDMELYFRSYKDGIIPEPKMQDGYKVYNWQIKNREGLIVDDNYPRWYRAFPQTYLSSFKEWSEVGKHFSKYYETEAVPPQVKVISDEIKKSSEDQKILARKALDFVQHEIRYLGIEIGSGGYIPRDPSKTLERRFGDCKDMTFLLVTILKDLGIEAYPLLVNTQQRKNITETMPSYTAFDHVIVYARIDGKDYFLDPTKGVQIGDNLDVIQQGDFGKGLVVASDSSGLIKVNPPRPEYYKDIVDIFSFDKTDKDTFILENISTYYMNEADSMYNWYQAEGHDVVEKDFLEFYQNSFPTIEKGLLVVQKNPEEGKVTFRAKYKIPNAWKADEKKKRMNFIAHPEDMNDDFPNFVGAQRSAPYNFYDPVRTRHTLKFNLDKSWNLDDENHNYEFPAFDFSKIATFKNGVYTEVYSYKSKQDHIMPEDFPRTMVGVKEVNDILGIELYDPRRYKAGKNSNVKKKKRAEEEPKENALSIGWRDIIIISLLLCMIGLLFWSVRKQRV